MPRTKLDRPKHPPIDWTKAAIMERKQALGVTSDELAAAAGISPSYFRKLLTTKRTEKWQPDIRKAVCSRLGISVKTTLSVIAGEDEVEIQ